MELGHALQVITELLALHSVSSFLHPTLGVPVGGIGTDCQDIDGETSWSDRESQV